MKSTGPRTLPSIIQPWRDVVPEVAIRRAAILGERGWSVGSIATETGVEICCVEHGWFKEGFLDGLEPCGFSLS